MKQKYQDYMVDQLYKLMAIDSPSGFTSEVEQYLVDELKRLGYDAKRQIKGGVYTTLAGEGNPIHLMAHVDTLGAMVDCIKPNGRLQLSRVGGLQANNVETADVRVRTRFDGVYDGTIQLINAAAHVNRDYATTPRTFEKTMEVVLDEDVRSAADVEKLGIRAGDYICVDPRTNITKSGYVKSRFLDDKASAAILLTLAKYIADEKVTPKRRVSIGFTVYEEVGHGAAAGIPDDVTELMSVDMGCVGEEMTCTERQVSICAKDEGGPYNYECTTALLKAAIDNHIDYAIDVYHNYSSDVDVSMKAGHDAKHTLIGPGVYASHGYERTHLNGMGATFDLLKAYIF